MAIGLAVVYYAWAARAFSAKINIGTVHQTFYTKTGEEVKSNE